MTSFRILFDEREREELLIAMNARKAQLVSRRNKARDRTEHAPSEVTLGRLEAAIDRAEAIIKTIEEESH